MLDLKNKTVFITGATRGIGREMALRFARDGANIVVTGKTAEQHPKLEGTIHTVAKEIEQAGGKALPIQLDVRDEDAIQAAVALTISTFGGIDVLVNNASAIQLTPTEQTAMKRYDLMQSVNARATFACAQACIPHLKKSANPHILTMSPPLNMQPKWFKDHLAYTMSKYGMSMCTLGLGAELQEEGIAVNSLWPKTTIATAAIEFNFPEAIFKASRKPAIVADAAYFIMTTPSQELTGQFLLDEDVLRKHGIHDFTEYANGDGALFPDLFLD